MGFSCIQSGVYSGSGHYITLLAHERVTWRLFVCYQELAVGTHTSSLFENISCIPSHISTYVSMATTIPITKHGGVGSPFNNTKMPMTTQCPFLGIIFSTALDDGQKCSPGEAD